MKEKIECTKKFHDYFLETLPKNPLTAKAVVKELLKNKNVKKNINLKIQFLSISDLLYKNKNIKSLSYYQPDNTFTIEY